MIPLIVIAAIVAIIIIIKKMFETSESSYSSSSHYTSSGNTSQSSSPVSNNKHTAKPSLSSYDIEHAKYLLKQLNESTNIVNHTTNPKTYFGRLNFIFDTLIEMTKYEKSGIYKGSSPTQNLNKLKNDLESSVNAFIDRAYEAQIIKTCSLKTEQGKINSLNKFFDSMFAAFECANTFWSGDSVKEHYIGKLFTSGNMAYLNSLHEECKQTYNLEGDIATAIKNLVPKTEKPKLIFDKAKEKELLAEYRKYKDNDPSGAYYAAIPLIDFYYKYRDLDDKYLNLCIEYCNICISLLSSQDMQEYISEGIFIPAFKKLVIIYDKKKEYEKALTIIDEAVKFDREVEYYEKKRAAILKKMNNK